MELSPKQRTVTAASHQHGMRVLQRVRESLTVCVRLILHEYDTVRRRAVMQKVYAWAAGGGVLTVSDRPGQELAVQCDTLPAMSALTWLDEMELSFTAYAVPFWEAKYYTSVTTDSTAALTLPGTADECPVACHVVNKGSGTLTELHLFAGDTQMTFTGLSIQPEESFMLHVNDGLLYAQAGDTSVLPSRTEDSDDLLLLPCASASSVSVFADQAVEATFSARGRYL